MATYSINYQVYDSIILDKFPKIYEMINAGGVEYTRNLRKLARLVMYERSEAVDLTKEEILVWMLDHPEVYEYIQL